MPDNATFQSLRPMLEVAADEAIKELEASTGKRVTPGHVLWLQAAAKELAHPDREVNKLCDLPTEVGGALLWPASYWARNWFCEVALPVYGMDVRALAFMLAHSFAKEKLEKIATREQLKKALTDWLKTLTCGANALRDAVDIVLGKDEIATVKNSTPGSAAPSASDWGDTIALLCDKYPGTQPLYWAARVSIDYCAEHAQRAMSDLPADKQTPDFNSVCRFHDVVAAIRKELTDGPK